MIKSKIYESGYKWFAPESVHLASFDLGNLNTFYTAPTTTSPPSPGKIKEPQRKLLHNRVT